MPRNGDLIANSGNVTCWVPHEGILTRTGDAYQAPLCIEPLIVPYYVLAGSVVCEARDDRQERVGEVEGGSAPVQLLPLLRHVPDMQAGLISIGWL
jgi:hypothetical protein